MDGRLAFFAVSVLVYGACSGERAHSTYMGCFEDASDRLLDGAREDSDALTPESCVDFCYRRRFQFAGVEYGKECFCGDSLKGKSRVEDSACGRQCSGDPTRVCGGEWRVGVYNTGLRLEDVKNLKAKYIGCYVEMSIKARLMRGYKKNFKGRLTNFLCHQYCKDLGFMYAGTQWKMECFCSNKRPSYKSRTYEDECNDKCDGNQQEKCGGSLRLSVYDISGSTENPMSSNYEGCFALEGMESLDVSQGISDIMTPEYCTALCYRHEFLYAGVSSGNTCRCGNKIGSKDADSACKTPCKGDLNLDCGGGNTHASVYRTAIPPPNSKPTNVTYEGCYEDSEERMLIGSAIPTALLTKSFCVEYCFRKAYRYAGLEYGFECYCGDHLSTHNEVSDNECRTPCSGNSSEKCGASWRISVYTTGVPVSEPEPTPPIIEEPPLSVVGPGIEDEAPQPKPSCEPSETLLYGERLCKGQTLLDEQFEGIDRKRWSHSIYMPEDPDHQFVVYRNDPENIYIKNGVLVIKPTLMDDELVRKGSILLRECTGKQGSEQCKREAERYNILPPVHSARIHTKDTLSFRYGKVEVRAKLPVGDWIVPEIWLEPKNSEYGEGYASGRIRIAIARGNKKLSLDTWELGNTLVESGVLFGSEDDVRGRAVDWNVAQDFHETFHNFTLVWTPDSISISVDGGKEYKLVENNQNLRELLNFKEKTLSAWKNGTSIAPFDQEFYVSLGLSVGGVRDFPDESLSGSYTKPWKNMEVKAMANFWLAKDKWYPTWKDEESALQIDYVKVTAL